MSNNSMPNIRAVLDEVLSRAECAELLYISRYIRSGLSVLGYRSAVASATVFEILLAYRAFLVPLVQAREKVRSAVEKSLGLDLGLLVEFTGLISWRPGAAIGWHHDANRPYLQQRQYAAVAYLNTGEHDFGGGAFQFQQGTPGKVVPAPGKVVAYHAHDVHRVLPVSCVGERFTLTLWFTTSPDHDEDPKVLAQLQGKLHPSPGIPSSMYQLPDGFDVRLCRLGMMGFALSSARAFNSTVSSTAASAGTALLPAIPSQVPEDCPGGPVVLVLNVPRLITWLAQAGQRVEACSGGCALCLREAEMVGGAPKVRQEVVGDMAEQGVVRTGVSFPCIEQAVLALHYWSWRWHPERWAQEDVYGEHLRGDLEGQKHCSLAGSSCSWALACSGSESVQGRGALTAGGQVSRGCSCRNALVKDVCAEVLEAVEEANVYLGKLGQQFTESVQGWKRVGALY